MCIRDRPLGDAQHPGYGEAGIFHEKKTEHPLPENTTLTFALVGNQNCGKTTLFNQLTGSNQHVGNFPGVTVDRKDGVIKEHPNTRITDLPGIYSMSPYSSEEIVTREFLLQDKPKGIINIVDATNIERNMYLTMQQMCIRDSPYNVMKLCLCHISTHTGQMVESFIILRFTRDFKSWKHVIDFSGNQARIDHRILAGTRMHSKAGNFKICLACIEVFILNFSFGIAIQSVGKLCSKFFYVKMISSTTDFLIWCKSD